MFINCITHVNRSHNNLSKINILEQNSNHLTKSKENINNLKILSFKNSPNNIFLKSSNKTLKPIKTKTTSNSANNKRYYKCNSISNVNYNILEKKVELNSMRKSLFYDKSNFTKKENNNETIAINKNFKKMKSGPSKQIINAKNLVKDNINDSYEENKIKNYNNDKNKENIKPKQLKSTIKLKNNFIGKETKAYAINIRNQSTNNKKRNIKKDSNINNILTSINNLKWKII